MATTTRIIYIVGPTASGKSALALTIAQKYNGEIICADSRTLYTGLDVATAKPSQEERALVPHWGLDLVMPDQRYSAADFQAYAKACIADIQGRGKLPLVVGGTGLYIDGLLYDFTFGPTEDAELRLALERLDIHELQEKITSSGIEMPENNKNKRYLIRALEQGGINRQRKVIPEDVLLIGLVPERAVLDERIRARAKVMLEHGALQEAEHLFETYGFDAPGARAPFYKAVTPYFTDGAPLEECLERYILNDRQLSKRQITWFMRNKSIHWFDSPEKALIFCYNSL